MRGCLQDWISRSVLDRAHTQVWKALCKPLNEVVAIKLLDLESVDCSLVCCC